MSRAIGQIFLCVHILATSAALAAEDNGSPVDLLTVESKWSGKSPGGALTTFTVVSRSDTEIVLERPSTDNKGFIVVPLKLDGKKLSVGNVSYRGPTNRVDRTLSGNVSMGKKALSLSYSVITNERDRWSEKFLLMRDGD